MGRRTQLHGAVLIAATVSGAIPSFAVESEITGEAADRIRLTCSGAMTAGGHESPIASDGVIDLVTAEVMGFGFGSAHIVVVTPATIGFDSSDTTIERVARVSEPTGTKPRRPPPTVVQGTIDRLTGAIRISVLSSQDPAEVLIAMALECRMEKALG